MRERLSDIRATAYYLDQLIKVETLPSMKELLTEERRRLDVRYAALYVLQNAEWKPFPPVVSSI